MTTSDDASAESPSAPPPATAYPASLAAPKLWLLTAVGIAFLILGFELLESPKQRRLSPILVGLGALAGAGAALMPVKLRTRWAVVLQLLLLIPTVSILPTALVMVVAEPAIGTLLTAGALFGAVGTILSVRVWGQRPSMDVADVE